MKSRKSQISIQFHWIFILIAGALILTFFVSIIMKQKSVSEQKIATTLITDLDEIISGAAAGDIESIHIVKIPETEIEYICTKEDYSEYSIKKTGIHRELPADIIFSPDLIKGKQIITWSLPWSFPFKIINFLILTSPEIKYIFISDSDNALQQQIQEDIPLQLNTGFYDDINNVPNLNNYKIKFIFIEKDPESIIIPDNLKNKDLSAIEIGKGASQYYYIQFYKKSGTSFIQDNSPIQLLPIFSNQKDAMLYAAIFAENRDLFQCAMKRVFKRLELISEIYKQKTEQLDLYPIPECENLYPSGNPFDNLDYCKNSINPTQDALIYIGRCIDNGAFEIQERNKVLSENACPLIY